jgi:hypothetical protein
MLLFCSISSLSAWLPKIKTKLAILASSLHLVPDLEKNPIVAAILMKRLFSCCEYPWIFGTIISIVVRHKSWTAWMINSSHLLIMAHLS